MIVCRTFSVPPLRHSNYSNVILMLMIVLVCHFLFVVNVRVARAIQSPPSVSHDNDRFYESIKANVSIGTLPGFKRLRSIMNKMGRGRWVITSYYLHPGSIVLDISANLRHKLDELSFAPWMIIKRGNNTLEPQKTIYHDTDVGVKNDIVRWNLAPIRAWSLQGIWNNILYKRFIIAFDIAASEMQRYYECNYGLKKYAQMSKILLSYYVADQFCDYTATKNKNFRIIDKVNVVCALNGDDVDAERFGAKRFSVKQRQNCFDHQLRSRINKLDGVNGDAKLTKNDLTELLNMAILSDVSDDTIKWIIASGGDVNGPFEYETPLMKSVKNPRIMKILLNHGADVNVKNPYGKTALFYAVQFGTIDAASMLLNAGANVNDRIYDISDLSKIYIDLRTDFFLPEIVAGFTPSVYALRYGSDGMRELLQKHGGKSGSAPVDRIEKWVSGG